MVLVTYTTYRLQANSVVEGLTYPINPVCPFPYVYADNNYQWPNDFSFVRTLCDIKGWKDWTEGSKKSRKSSLFGFGVRI